MAHQVFIGYATPDKKIANDICSLLEGRGIPCWIAPRDVPVGRFGGVIVEAVNQSKMMVFIFSAHSNASTNCLSEVHTAFNKRITIIPLRIDNAIASDDMEYYLGLYHWLDAQQPPIENHLEALADRVQRMLAENAAREEAAAKRKVQQEEEAKARKQAEETRAQHEATEAKKAEELALKKKEEEKAARARLDAEEALKAHEEAIRARKEAEEAAKEKELQEAERVKARQEAEEAKKAREAALKAKKEAEEALKERQREEEEAAKARKEAEKARKASEAAIRERGKTEKAEEEKRAREAARRQREAEKATRALEKKPGMMKIARVWAGIGIIVVAALGVTLKYTMFNSGTSDGEIPQPTPIESVAANATSENMTELPGGVSTGNATKTEETPVSPTEFLAYSFYPTVFGKTDIVGGETFYANISGNISCLKDIPLTVNAVRIVSEISARTTSGGGATVILNPSSEITVKDIPATAGSMVGFEEKIPVQFPEEAPAGSYKIVMKIKETKIDVGWWVDVADYFDLSQELTLGTVEYTNVSTYNYLEGYIRDAATKEPILDVYVVVLNPNKPFDSRYVYPSEEFEVIAKTHSDNLGYYRTQGFLNSGPLIIRATVDGYETQWYDNANDSTTATRITFQQGGETKTIDFNLMRLGTISGKVISDADGKGIANVDVFAFTSSTNVEAAKTLTNADGTYTLTGLLPGKYRVQAIPSNKKLPYADEYYNNIYYIWDGKEISVTSGQNISKIDISLAPGGTISGTVRNADGTIPLSNINITCDRVVNGKTVAFFQASTDSQGNYTIYGVLYGDYSVRANDFVSNNNYVQKHYPEMVTVNITNNPTNINFYMETGGSISGRIISEVTSESIFFVHVFAVDYDTGEWVSADWTAVDGTYSIHGLPSGRYKIGTATYINGLPYIDEYYTNTNNSTYATAVYVTVGNNTPNIDFSLAPSS